VKVAEVSDRSAGQAWRDRHALTLAHFTRSITAMETVGQVEEDLAVTLRTIAVQATGTVATRRLKLAENAAQAAQTAAGHARRLRQQALEWAGHADGRAPVKPALYQRLADIDRRLAELRLATPKPPDDDPAPRAMRNARWCAQEAQRHCREAVAHLLQARQLATEVLYRSATAHDCAAEAHARSAGAGIGDVAEHDHMVAFHRAAAQADRQRAQEAGVLFRPNPGDGTGTPDVTPDQYLSPPAG